MPLTHRIDETLKAVIITGDYAEPAEWKLLLATVAADPAYRPGFSLIRDLRKSAHPVSTETVVGIIEVVRQFWGVLGAYRAAIVTRPGIDLPAVVAQALAEDQNIPLRAFTSFEDAVSWIQQR